MLNPSLILGATLVLMPRFGVPQVTQLLTEESITMMPLVPPAMNALCLAAEAGQFPKNHKLTWVKSGAAPLAPELPRRFTALTGILVCQGYGMTEASPVTHSSFLEPELYRPDSIGHPLAQTECRVIGTENPAASAESAEEVPTGEPGELVMRGPQFMQGYWKEPEATAAVLRDGWYWSGDVVTRDAEGFYRVVDRRKEMIKYKGFPWRRRRWKRCCWSIRRCGSAEWWDVPMRRRARFRWRSLPCAMGLRTAGRWKMSCAHSSPTG